MVKKSFDLGAFKDTLKLAPVQLKEDTYVVVDACLQSVLGLPGIPLGHITQIYGRTDTGKTSLLFHAAAQAQKQGIMPVVIITEGKVDWNRAKAMGFDKETAIVNDGCDYLEDVFGFIDKIASAVAMGDLPYDVLILWDSIGNTLSKDEVTVNADGTMEKKATMMKAAKVITENMRVISKKINDSRKMIHPKSVGLLVLNQAYTTPPAWPGAMPTITPYGGVAILYRSSLIIKTNRSKRLEATSNKRDVKFGIVTKIVVEKNHISNVCNEGEFVITADTIIPNDKTAIDAYKAEHKAEWGEDVEIKAIYDEDR